jgi:IS5 family transposase
MHAAYVVVDRRDRGRSRGAPTLDLLDDLCPLPDEITVHLDSGYDSGKTRDTLTEHGLHGEIAPKGEKAPIQAHQALARKADQRLAQRLQPATTLLRTPPGRGRRVLRPRRHDHHPT